MKERPILFTGPMVRAILDGRKTQTRRVIKLQPNSHEEVAFDTASFDAVFVGDEANHIVPCPYGVPGDRLWVRETWWHRKSSEIEQAGFVGGTVTRLDDGVFYYHPNEQFNPGSYDIWTKRNPLFMPRWASRITLEIVSVRVQRVQEITDFDSFKEGVEAVEADTDDGRCLSFKAGFRRVWDLINTERGFGWVVNPWVWAIEFTRITT